MINFCSKKSNIETSASNGADCPDWVSKLQSGPGGHQTASEPSQNNVLNQFERSKQSKSVQKSIENFPILLIFLNATVSIFSNRIGPIEKKKSDS